MKDLFDYVDCNSFPDRDFKRTKSKDLSAKPFVQWVGGKRQLLAKYEEMFPAEYGNYFEPFAGGAAVFFWQYSKFGDTKQYTLSDMNKELVIAYNTVKNDPETLVEYLEKLNNKHTKEFFYHVRNIDRTKTGNMKYKKQFDICSTLNDVSIAARFIYMNKTCFNGIYRVSGDGMFNVPIGKTLKKDFVDKEKILACSKALQNVDIVHESYANVANKAQEGDLVFFDPPYEPVSKTSSFTEYTTDGFSFENQKELKDIFQQLVDKGCNVLLSNSVNEKILDLYKEHRVELFEVNRNLNSKADKRKNSAKEILAIGKKNV